MCPVLVPSELLLSTHLPTSEGWTAELAVGFWLVAQTTGIRTHASRPRMIHCALATWHPRENNSACKNYILIDSMHLLWYIFGLNFYDKFILFSLQVRLIIVCLLGPVDIGLAAVVAWKFFDGPGNLIFRMVGGNMDLQRKLRI